MRTKTNTPDVYQIVTDQIIEKLSAGTIPWKQPWTHTAPCNYATKKPYRGINTLLLGMLGLKNPYFLTYKQAQQLGGQVKKGAKSHLVVFWQFRKFDAHQNKWSSAEEAGPGQIIPFLKYYRVFAIQDVHGLDYRAEQTSSLNEDTTLQDIERGHQLLEQFPKLTLKTNFDRASYSPGLDMIRMPSMHNFHSISGYFQVLYHELTHASGHPERLNRDGVAGAIQFGNGDYSKEELIAELGSCFLMNKIGFISENILENSASYIQHWLEVLQNDKKFLLEAAGKAQQAVDFIFPSTDHQEG